MVNANDDDPSRPTDSDGFAPLDHTLIPENEHQPEYLIERFNSAGRGEDGTMHYRVHWSCCTPGEDIWQEPQTIPASFIAPYWRKMGSTERSIRRGHPLAQIRPKCLATRGFPAARRFTLAPASWNKFSPQAIPEEDLGKL
ncbi:unnamed protein product [Agarophyton chilense]